MSSYAQSIFIYGFSRVRWNIIENESSTLYETKEKYDKMRECRQSGYLDFIFFLSYRWDNTNLVLIIQKRFFIHNFETANQYHQNIALNIFIFLIMLL